MADKKKGIILFKHTEQIAGLGDPPNRNLKFQRRIDPAGDDTLELLSMSDLEPDLADCHVDIGKTMGVRKIIIDVIETIDHGANAVGFKNDGNPNESSPDTGFDAWVVASGQINNIVGPDYDDVSALDQSLQGTHVAETNVRHDEFTHDQFLLLNLNFKSPSAGTSVDQTNWTFGTQASREANGIYSDADIGKVAFQTDEESWWVLASRKVVPNTNPVQSTPGWKSQDLRSQIVSGIVTSRPVLFFKPAPPDLGVSYPYYAYIESHKLKFQTGGHPPRDARDQRALYGQFGDGGFYGFLCIANQFGADGIDDPAFLGEGNAFWWATEDFGSNLGVFADQASMLAGSYDADDVGKQAIFLEGLFPIVATLTALPNTFNIGAQPTRHLGDPVDHPFSWAGGGPSSLAPGSGVFRVRPVTLQTRVIMVGYEYED